MNILAHRGIWQQQEEKNTKKALISAFQMNFGIETDIRDYKGELVVSHDIATDSSIALEELFQIYKELDSGQTLALNVKADGLGPLVKELLEKYQITNYFLFDMSVPEMVSYRVRNLNYYSRFSDIEKNPVLYENAIGIWYDSFFDESVINMKQIERFLDDGKRVCLVSAELHGREYEVLWREIREHQSISNQILLCTDYPEYARRFFNESN